jgi:hypothetical protein
MAELIKTLAAVALIIAALAPVLLAGGACIAAFMMGKHIAQHLGVTVVTTAALVGAAYFLMSRSGSSTGFQVLDAVILAAAPWLIYLAGKKLVLDKLA